MAHLESASATATAPRLVYTIREVAAVLSISRSQVYALMRTGDLPYTKVGSCRRVRVCDLLRYLEGPQTAGKAVKHGKG